jgi:neutral trehalase
LVEFPPFAVEAVDATTYVARDCAALAALASERGEDALAQRFRSHALKARQMIITKSWDADAAAFWNLHVDSGHPVRIRSWTGLLPLWAGFLPKRMAARLVEANLTPGGHFWSRHGVTSLGRSEPAFSSARRAYLWDHTKQKRGEVSNWQGPVWILPSALIAEGLAGAGYRDLALAVCRNTLRTLNSDLATSGKFHECYDPNDGTPLWSPEFLSWNALALGLTRWANGRSASILPPGLSAASLQWL